MSFPNFPNPTRRNKLLHAHQLRQQGLTLRQIAEIMNCAHSTVSVYLSDFELFRTDLIQELAADQIVSHVIQLADLADEHHDRRLAALRELRLLLTAVPHIRRDEDDRVRELTQGGVSVDRYGNRYPAPSRIYPPTPQETAELEQNAQLPAQTELDPDQPLTVTSDPLSPPLRGEMSRSDRGGGRPTNRPTNQPTNQPHPFEQNRTNPNTKPAKTQPTTANPPSTNKNPRPRPNTPRPAPSQTKSEPSSNTQPVTGSTTTPNTTPTTHSDRPPSNSKPKQKPPRFPGRSPLPPLRGPLQKHTNPISLPPLRGEMSRSDRGGVARQRPDVHDEHGR